MGHIWPTSTVSQPGGLLGQWLGRFAPARWPRRTPAGLQRRPGQPMVSRSHHGLWEDAAVPFGNGGRREAHREGAGSGGAHGGGGNGGGRAFR
jgi:hypothetical protein